MIEAKGVEFAYGNHLVVDGVGLRSEGGEVVGLVGPNGSGKTTFLRTLHHALTPRAGRVTLDDEPVDRLGAREIARRVAVVVQEPTDGLALAVADVVLLGRMPHRGAFSRTTGHDEAVAADSLERVGMLHRASDPFVGLSGGERQRVLIARALAQETTHLLLDEPTNHLDVRYQHEVLALVRSLGISVVVVLHDLNLAATYCDRIVLLDSGRVVADGPTDEVLTPAHLEPVYRMRVDRLDIAGRIHLAFSSPDQSARPMPPAGRREPVTTGHQQHREEAFR